MSSTPGSNADMTGHLPPAPVIGVAGGIGSGKSEAARLLGEMGCVVTHSDEDVRAILVEPEVRKTLIAWWGPDILDASGAVDRRAVGRIVFADEAARRQLEELVHPLVEARRKSQWVQAAGNRSVTAFVIDAPLLFEAGLDRKCDAVIFVDAGTETRLSRVRQGRGWDRAELERREKNQWPLETKRERSDHVIVNEGEVADLRHRLRLILDEILAKHALRQSSRDSEGGS